MDLRPGGRRTLVMEVQTPNGPIRMSFAGEFREVIEPRRLVYTEANDDHPETRVELEFVAEGGRTRLILTHQGIPADSPGAAGWAMALEHLAARVAGLSNPGAPSVDSPADRFGQTSTPRSG